MKERLGRLLAMTGKVVRENFDQDLAAVGSSLNTYVVLRTIDAGAGMSQRQLAATLGIEGPTMTHHLDRLAADGLILRVRDPGDRRAYHVELTEAGRAHLERVEVYAIELDRDFRSLFTPAEVELLTELLTRIRDRYQKEADVNATR
ncbi:MAG: MarR family transcriptional regulator [Actinomycetota bacterium]|nr:MarR family transcriptional regulator [Actinomycetota bacterium]